MNKYVYHLVSNNNPDQNSMMNPKSLSSEENDNGDNPQTFDPQAVVEPPNRNNNMVVVDHRK